VRLSFCLDEWARLAEKYPKALQRLEAKATVAELERTRRPALFHDFISINEYLGQERTSIDLFSKVLSSGTINESTGCLQTIELLRR
jgi:hypothetical protein